MALPLNSDVPIAKLDRYTINAEIDPYDYDPPGHYLFPLTNTVSCSQVCSFWRTVILEPPSIWGNCFDLEILCITSQQQLLWVTTSAYIFHEDTILYPDYLHAQRKTISSKGKKTESAQSESLERYERHVGIVDSSVTELNPKNNLERVAVELVQSKNSIRESESRYGVENWFKNVTWYASSRQ
ncbi:hypothetical protein BJ912DRAFT_1042119 [Pholiota molesta]|nr:hypothetical protein BJ912DRAFT_1042119 [Pholiota molesta]